MWRNGGITLRSHIFSIGITGSLGILYVTNCMWGAGHSGQLRVSDSVPRERVPVPVEQGQGGPQSGCERCGEGMCLYLRRESNSGHKVCSVVTIVTELRDYLRFI